MANRGILGTQAKYEEIQFFIRKHWTHFIGPIVFGILIGVMAALFFLILGYIVTLFRITLFYSLYSFTLIIVSILYINTFFLQVINYFFDLVIVTDHRIIINRKTVFLRNDNDAIDLTKIQDIGVIAHGFLRNYLNYGALLITLSTSLPPIFLNSVPNPHFYLERMNRVKRENILHRQEHRGLIPNENPANSDPYLQSIDKL
jgi:hypothetical protein